MADHDTHDHTGVPGVGTTVADIVDIPAAETDTALRLAPDGVGGVEWSTGGTPSEITDIPTSETDTDLVLHPDGIGGVEWGAGGSGGGGMTQSYVGYNTIGGSTESTSSRIIAKSITLADDCLVTSIDVYVKQTSAGNTIGLGAGIWTDSSGPSILIAGSQDAADSYFLSTSNGAAGAARWISIPIGKWLTAGTYWFGINTHNGGSNYQVYYDGSGSDRTYVPTTARMSDAGWTTVTTTSNRYSIRASIMTNGASVGALGPGLQALWAGPTMTNAEDDHFAGTSLDAKWLAYTGYDATPTFTLDSWVGLSNGAKLQAVPGGDWDIRCAVLAGDHLTSGYSNSGLILTNGTTATTSSDRRFGVGVENGFSNGRIVLDNFVNNVYSSTPNSVTGQGMGYPIYYLRITKVSTTYNFLVSKNGYTWTLFSTFAGSLGITPTHFGLVVAHVSTPVVPTQYDWFVRI